MCSQLALCSRDYVAIHCPLTTSSDHSPLLASLPHNGDRTQAGIPEVANSTIHSEATIKRGRKAPSSMSNCANQKRRLTPPTKARSAVNCTPLTFCTRGNWAKP